jgi:hypothetical protein
MLVRVYRNLHRQCYSIQTKVNGRWKVTEHRQSLALRDVSFKVYEAGRQRTIREGKKCVHSYVIGEPYEPENLENTRRVRYNPYIAGHFFLPDGSPIHQAARLECNETGVWV